jgi:hypothetical protein
MPWLLYPQGKSCWYPLDRRLEMVLKRKIPSPHWELKPNHLII